MKGMSIWMIFVLIIVAAILLGVDMNKIVKAGADLAINTTQSVISSAH